MFLIGTLRIRQWSKNSLVLLVPFIVWKKGVSFSYLELAAVFFAMSILSSMIYILNDLRDKESDRLHPVKSVRPISSGAVSTRLAYSYLSACLVLFLILNRFISSDLRVLFLLYFGINLFYIFGGKNIPIFEMFLVSSGFVIRVFLGAFFVEEVPSKWLIICSFFGSFYLVVAKRYAEKFSAHNSNFLNLRSSLNSYSLQGLRTNLSISSAVFVGGYFQWATEMHPLDDNNYFGILSAILLFVIIVNYNEVIMAGKGQSPEVDLFSGVFSKILLICFLLLFIFGA